jgi:hypothetical protein
MTVEVKKKTTVSSWAWCCMSIIPAHGRLRQEDHEFEASLDFIARPCSIKPTGNQTKPKKSTSSKVVGEFGGGVFLRWVFLCSLAWS